MQIRNVRDVAAQAMTKPDQEGLIVKYVVNRGDTGGAISFCSLPRFRPARCTCCTGTPTRSRSCTCLRARASVSPKACRCA